jgi:hypothetical protein
MPYHIISYHIKQEHKRIQFSFKYSFLVLFSFSPRWIVTNLHVFLSLSYFFLIFGGFPKPVRFSSPWGKSKYFYALSEIPHIFYLERAELLSIPNRILQDIREEISETHTTEKVWGKTWKNGILMWNNCATPLLIWTRKFHGPSLGRSHLIISPAKLWLLATVT